jgi:hypothetical protein
MNPSSPTSFLDAARRQASGWLLMGLLSGLVACGDDTTSDPVDGSSTPDAATDTADGTVPDAQPSDVDGGATDAGTPDSDSGTTDGGESDVVPDVEADIDAGPDSFFDPDVDDGDEDGESPEGVPVIEAIDPREGPEEGGTLVFVFGSGFTPETRVLIDGRAIAGVDFVDANTLLLTTSATAPGTYDVKVTDAGGESSLAGAFTFLADLTVRSVSPERGPARGGVPATLLGEGFTIDTAVSIGGRSVLDLDFVSTTELRFSVPPGVPGLATVRVTDRAGTRLLEDAFTYYAEPEIASVSPGAGPAAGGNPVEIVGTGLSADTLVTFGETTVAARSATLDASGAGRIEVLAPAQAEGVVDIAVTNDNGSALLPDAYWYVGAAGPEVALGVSPRSGNVEGGIRVTIAGRFAENVDTIQFGGVDADVVSNSSFATVVTLPAAARAGLVDVRVTFGSGASVTLDDAFEYLASVELDSITPSVGPSAGGTPVVLRGVGFAAPVRVTVDGVAASDVRLVSGTEVRAVTPPGIAGSADVVVSVPGSTASLVDGFTYESELTVTSFIPRRGSIAGNTYVVVRGTGFTPDCDVLFDGESATEITLLDAGTLAVRTPPGEEGAVKLEVVRDGDSIAARERYTYFDPFSDAGGWWGAPIDGAVNVTVANAGNGDRIPGAFVTLHLRATENEYVGLTNEAGQVTISYPEIRGVQTVTAIAAGFSAATVTNVDAENVVIYLTSSEPPSGEPPEPVPWATVTGTLTGLDKITDPGPNEVLLAVIRTTTPSPGGENPPGTGFTQVEYEGGVSSYTYSMPSRFGDQAIVGICGVFNTVTEEFTPLYMGIYRGIVGRSGETYTANLDCSIPMDESIAFKFVNPPFETGGADTNTALAFLDFGSEGGIDLLYVPRGRETILTGNRFVDLSEPELTGLRWFFVGQVEPAAGGLPFSVNYVRNLVDPGDLVIFDPFLPPANLRYPSAPAYRLLERRFEWTLSTDVDADFYYAFITDITQETTYWEVYLPGDESGFNLPFFPPDAGVTGLPSGEPVVLIVLSIDAITFDYDSFDLNDFSANNWRAYSANGWVIQN